MYYYDALSSKFTGKQRDSESGLDYFNARYNSSVIGRFMTADPAGKGAVHMDDPQTWNMYAYVRNNPTSLTDPTGLEGCTVDNEKHGSVWCWLHNHFGTTFVMTQHEFANAERKWLSQTPIYRNGKRVDLSKETDQSVIDIGMQVSLQQFDANRPEALMGLSPPPIPGYPYMEKPNVTNRELQDIVDELYQPTDQVPGGTGGAVRYERITKILLSPKGHTQEAGEQG